MKKGIRWLIKMFYNTGNEKVTEKIFLRAMISSVLGIILCTVCLAGMTWAWFSDSVTSHSSNITSASFSVKVTVNKGTDNTEIPLTDGKYKLEQSSEKYKVTLKATGSASTVYCKVNINGVIYTARLNLNSNNAPFIFEFEIDCSAKSATVTFTPTWSNSGSSENSNALPSNDTIEVK